MLGPVLGPVLGPKRETESLRNSRRMGPNAPEPDTVELLVPNGIEYDGHPGGARRTFSSRFHTSTEGFRMNASPLPVCFGL